MGLTACNATMHRGKARLSWATQPRRFLAVPNVTAYPSLASVPITILLYNGPLFCGFNVPTIYQLHSANEDAVSRLTNYGS